MREEICCINNKGKMAKNEWENDGSDFLRVSYSVSALQIRANQWSITATLWPLTTHIYHVMIIVTSDLPKKYFFIFRSSCTQMFFKTGVIRNITIFSGKHFFNFNLVPRETFTQVDPVRIAKFLWTAFFMEHFQWLLLSVW